MSSSYIFWVKALSKEASPQSIYTIDDPFRHFEDSKEICWDCREDMLDKNFPAWRRENSSSPSR
jgi:hypothetical protein